MDRVQVCGTCDVGSIPTGGTKIKIADFLSVIFIFASNLENTLLS